jgi:hypothetical protein
MQEEGRRVSSIWNTIRNAWGWCGIEPAELIATSAFGNVIVQDAAGEIWRIRPEELDAGKIADSLVEYEALRGDPDFVADWAMERLRLEAEALLGEPGEGRCYCLKYPGIFGGQYIAENCGTICIGELLATSGSLALQIKDVPNGGKVRLVVKKPD